MKNKLWGISELLMRRLSWSVNSMFWLGLSFAVLKNIFLQHENILSVSKEKKCTDIWKHLQNGSILEKKKNETHIASLLHFILISENGILYFEADQLR